MSKWIIMRGTNIKITLKYLYIPPSEILAWKKKKKTDNISISENMAELEFSYETVQDCL